jgi:Fe-Mn family superoxide dismutase
MRDIITLLESKSKPQDLEIIPLNFTPREVSPVLSNDTIDLHYGKLAHGYAERYNNKEGDMEFNYAGVFLHNTLPMFGFINKHFGNFENFKKEFEKVAMTLQGSNWVYLADNGTIKTIKNHEVKDDILLLIDWWEHAWILDYGSDKKKYLNEQWKIINWNVINTRWGHSL